MEKNVNMKAKKQIKDLPYLLFIFIATLFMSIGYASIDSISLNIGATAEASVQQRVFITDVEYVSNVDADLGNSEIKNFIQSTMNSKISLSETNGNSSITYRVELYNNSNMNYYFDKVNYDSSFYDNEDIIFTLNGLERLDEIASNNSLSFTISFSYKNNVVADDNILNSYLNFSFLRKYNITYTLYDDVSEVESYLEGENVNTLLEPTRSGFTFKGWYDENNNLVTSIDSISSDIELHADWEENIIVGSPEKGDTVIYNPVASSENSSGSWYSEGVLGYSSNDHSYYVSSNYMGMTPVNPVFTQENLGWKIWDINDNEVRIVSDTPTTQRLSIQKVQGYNNGLFFLNDICSKLYAGDADGITAKNLTHRDIEEKMILHYAQENPNATGYVDSDGNPIWSENNIKNIINVSNYGTTFTIASGKVKYIPMVLSNNISNRTTSSQTTNISLSDVDLEEDYSTATVVTSPMTSTYWTGRDYTTGGTKRPVTGKHTFYQLSTDVSNYFDSIDYDMIFNKDSYWLSSRSTLLSTTSSSPSFRFFIRFVSENNTVSQYIMDTTSDKTGTTGSTIGDDGYSLRLRPIVTIDRSKYDLVKNSDDTYRIVAK